MQPLSKKRRILSLGFLLIVFFIGVPVLLAYSSGYRFSLKDFRIVETGGIYIHSDLSATRVFLDGEFHKNSGTILRNTLIQKLPSEQVYSIRIEKDDHFPYYKDLYVYPNTVTEVHPLMTPMDLEFTEVIATVETREVVPTGITGVAATPTTTVANPEYEQIALLFATSTEVMATTTSIEIETPFNKNASTTTLLLNEQVVLLPDYILELNIPNIQEKDNLTEKGRTVAWLEGGDIHVVWAGDREDTPYYFCDIRGCRDKIIVSTDTDINDYDYYPDRNDAFLITTANDIFAIEIDDRSRNNLQPVFTGEFEPQFRIVGSTLYIKDGEKILETQF